MSSGFGRQIRRSQVITTFGPGSIVDLREESVMMAGIHRWPETAIEIHEPTLEAALGVSGFRMPAVSSGFETVVSRDLPAVLFPRWQVCPGCNRLAPANQFAGLFQGANRIKCRPCDKYVFPARLVIACRAGHIEDFPWIDWVHRGDDCPDGRASLRWITLGRTASLADVLIRCDCGAVRSLAGATYRENFKDVKCLGKQPWLLRDEGNCDQRVIPLQRGASNVYFASVRSALSIPPWSDAIHATLNRYWSTLRVIPEDALEATVTGLGIPAKVHMTPAEVVRAIGERKQGESGGDTIVDARLRYQEYLALRRGKHNGQELDEFRTRETGIADALQGVISKVILVDRLREVRALHGFSRVDAPDPFDVSGVRLARLSPDRLDWLPAIEVRGEGIYFELDPGRLAGWEKQAGVKSRATKLDDAYADMCERRGWDKARKITPRLVLIHSLAHALIRQLSLEAGYASASIRERLYVFEPGQMEEESQGGAGILLYTSTVDSEGSLGGLVRQGLTDRFTDTVLGAIQECAWCSSDPLCIESEGQGPGMMNLAACHACLLIAETSCEEFNRLLDRALLIGTPEEPDLGFFSGLLES